MERTVGIPRLISSTNAIFYKDFVNEVPKNLPVWRGGSGQDYPTGTTSTAITTAVHRNNQSGLTLSKVWQVIPLCIRTISISLNA